MVCAAAVRKACPRVTPTRPRNIVQVLPEGRFGPWPFLKRWTRAAAASPPRLMPFWGGLCPCNGDLHPFNGERELDPLVDGCEVNDHPLLIPHGGDAMATPNGRAGAGGHVITAEILEPRQMVDVAGRLGFADAHIPNG